MMTRKRPLAVALCLISAALLASAQDSSTKASAISGTVVKEPGSEPLKKVLVQVVAEDQKQGGIYSASTDADGRFRINDVIPGRYRIFFERPGFVEVNARGHKADVDVITLEAGQSLNDMLFRMLPTAVISGRITDEDGDPMSQVTLVVEKKKPGKSGRKSVGSVGTNDLGEYRIAGLFPGQYWITATPPPDFRDYEHHNDKPLSADTPLEVQADTRYVTTYYPGTYDALQASALTLKAGDEMPINMTLVPSRTFRVRGIVSGLVPSQKPSVELVSRTGDALRSCEVASDGQFEVRGVGPGSYLIRAIAGDDAQILTAQKDVSVVSGDVEGIKLTPQSSFTISGHLRAEGNRPVNLSQYSVHLRPDDTAAVVSLGVFGAIGNPDRSGNLQWKNVNPGNYTVQLFGGEEHAAFLRSVTLAGRDVSVGFTATGPATVEILVSTLGAKIQGMVVDREKDADVEHPVANATVVAVPEEKYRKLPDHFATGSSDQQGRFSLRGLPPGSYTVYAWLDPEDEVWLDASFLKVEEPYGTSVSVNEGAEQRVQLKLSPIPEEWR